MDTPIEISYRWSAEEMLLINRLHTRHSPQLRKLNLSLRRGAVMFVVIGCVCLSAFGATPQKWPAIVGGGVLVLLGVTFLTVPPIFMRRMVLRAYAKKADRDLIITY